MIITLEFNLIFLLIATNIVLFSFLTVTAHNAVGALISLVLTFISLSCFYILLHFEFFAVINIILYVGAISVLFLFAIMLFDLKSVVRKKTKFFIFQNIIVYFLILTSIIFFFQNNYDLLDIVDSISDDYEPKFKVIGRILWGIWIFYLDHAALPSEFVSDPELFFKKPRPGWATASDLELLGVILYKGSNIIYLLITSIILLITLISVVLIVNTVRDRIQTQYALNQITKKEPLSKLNKRIPYL